MFRKPTRKLKKLISGILIGLGLRYITNSVSSIKCLVNYKWNCINNSWLLLSF